MGDTQKETSMGYSKFIIENSYKEKLEASIFLNEEGEMLISIPGYEAIRFGVDEGELIITITDGVNSPTYLKPHKAQSLTKNIFFIKYTRRKGKHVTCSEPAFMDSLITDDHSVLNNFIEQVRDLHVLERILLPSSISLFLSDHPGTRLNDVKLMKEEDNSWVILVEPGDGWEYAYEIMHAYSN